MAEFGQQPQRAKRSPSRGVRAARAFFGALAVLILAGLTWSALFLAPPSWHLRFPMNDAPAWFAAIVASFSIAAFYLTHRPGAHGSVDDMEKRLSGAPKGRSEFAKRSLFLELDAKVFEDHFDRIAKTGDDVMLICREGKEKKLYDTDKIAEQLQKISNSPMRHRVKWAVFTDNTNKFVAFQDFETFLVQFLGSWTSIYRSALNEIDPEKFRDELQNILRMQAEASEAPGQPYLRVPNANLEFRTLDLKDTRREMIAKLFEYGIAETVVVAGGKPVGVITLADLVGGAFGPMLENRTTAH